MPDHWNSRIMFTKWERHFLQIQHKQLNMVSLSFQYIGYNGKMNEVNKIISVLGKSKISHKFPLKYRNGQDPPQKPKIVISSLTVDFAAA